MFLVFLCHIIMKTIVFFIITLCISCGCLIAATNTKASFPLFAVAFGIWFVFFWGWNRRLKKQAPAVQENNYLKILCAPIAASNVFNLFLCYLHLLKRALVCRRCEPPISVDYLFIFSQQDIPKHKFLHSQNPHLYMNAFLSHHNFPPAR